MNQFLLFNRSLSFIFLKFFLNLICSITFEITLHYSYIVKTVHKVFKDILSFVKKCNENSILLCH